MNLREYRLGRLSASAEERGFDLVVASLPQNIVYLSGYKSINQDVLNSTQAYAAFQPSTGRIAYIASIAEVPSIVETAGEQAEIFTYGGFRFAGVPGDKLYEIVSACRKAVYPSAEEALSEAIKSFGVDKAALDEGRVSVTTWEKVTAACRGVAILPGAGLFSRARIVKHHDEIAGLEVSAEIAEQSLLKALENFKPGMREIDLEFEYKKELSRRGAAFLFFVATAAKRAAYSDTRNTELSIQKGDMIRFDFGCTMDGYTSDLARTAVAGEPSPKIRDYYEALKRGTLDAIAIIKPGVIAQDIFKVAVDSTIRNGLAGYERHHCGHGIGLEIYDLPSVAPGCETPIEENMTLCIETPYYELGWGGLQIEHTVAVTKNGTRRLDKTSSDLIVLNA